MTVQRRLNLSAINPPSGLKNAYTHMNTAMSVPKSWSLAMLGMSARIEARMVETICRSR